MSIKLTTLLVLCGAAMGCVVTEDAPPPSPSRGTLTALWTLDGADDALVCSYYAVDYVDVAIFDDEGFVVVDAQPYCEDFGVSFDLRPEWYSAEVTLVDVGGHAVSDTIIVDTQVPPDTEVFVDIDFPDSTIF